MQFTFLDMAGKTLFLRDDADRAQWTVEEMTLDLEFPYLAEKEISTGQRVFFIAPTGESQIFEIKQAKTFNDEYQQVTAEHIVISELSDEHTDKAEITDKKCSQALEQVLEGTLWSVGNTPYNPKSSVDISRGSVWQAVLEIEDNYNVYITPRVTISENGTITRKLDVTDTKGVWNGMRLSIDKNMLDPAVTYDDSETVTALFGYGGTDPKEENAQEVTFENVTWAKTADHPAKPKGQKYLEDPTATAAYGRNGRPRYGYYQNTDILDPEVLLQKTWETLQTLSAPAISIEGSVADLYRMGYADTPIRLHDLAIVDINPTGLLTRLQIIKLVVDLLDPSATVPTIGAYIPNIIYIERKTNETATGGRGGGGGNTSEETTWQEFRTTINFYKDNTGMQIKAVQNDIANQSEEIEKNSARLEVVYNQITAEVTARQQGDLELAGRIQVNSDAVGMVVEKKKDGYVIKSAEIVASINGDKSNIKLKADHIDIDGLVSHFEAEGLSCGDLDCGGSVDVDQDVSAGGTVSGLVGSFTELTVGSDGATWKQATYKTYVLSATHNFVYGNSYVTGQIVTGSVDHTIHYLGK